MVGELPSCRTSGTVGSNALSKVADQWGGERTLNLTDCNAACHDPTVFNPDEPDGKYLLDMSKLYNQIVFRVCRGARATGGDMGAGAVPDRLPQRL